MERTGDRVRGSETPRRVPDAVPADEFAADLETYRRLALELGATDARIIDAADIIIDERVRGKCRYPTCPSYGTNMNCPPYTMGIDEFRTLVSRYRKAVFFKVDIRSANLEDHTRATRTTVTNIVWRLESAAFYDGYYLATGFGGTNCKDIFCRTLECAAIAGKGCRHPFKARPGMHGLGIDVFRMAARVGWELYPMGSSCDGTSVPFMSTMGLVLID
jgi:predicted metal-binding protein